MKRIRMLAILFAAILGCSSEGGPVGSGLSGSSVSGNIVAVEVNALAAATLPTVHVAIDEVPGLATDSSTDGTFVLTGQFSGAIIVRFTAPDVNATLPLEVPAGSTTVVSDIVIRTQSVEVGPVRQLGFLGHVALVDCAGSELLVNDRGMQSRQFMVRLTADTVFVRGNGDVLQCSDLQVGDAVAIEGVLRASDHTVEAVTVTVAPPPPGQPQPIQALRFHGTVAVVNCESSMLFIVDTSGQSRLRLTSTGVIVNGAQQPLRCAEINVGDRVEGHGTINVRHPGAIDVTMMLVRPPAPL
jgi:hypothetical protein